MDFVVFTSIKALIKTIVEDINIDIENIQTHEKQSKESRNETEKNDSTKDDNMSQSKQTLQEPVQQNEDSPILSAVDLVVQKRNKNIEGKPIKFKLKNMIDIFQKYQESFSQYYYAYEILDEDKIDIISTLKTIKRVIFDHIQWKLDYLNKNTIKKLKENYETNIISDYLSLFEELKNIDQEKTFEIGKLEEWINKYFQALKVKSYLWLRHIHEEQREYIRTRNLIRKLKYRFVHAGRVITQATNKFQSRLEQDFETLKLIADEQTETMKIYENELTIKMKEIQLLMREADRKCKETAEEQTELLNSKCDLEFANLNLLVSYLAICNRYQMIRNQFNMYTENINQLGKKDGKEYPWTVLSGKDELEEIMILPSFDINGDGSKTPLENEILALSSDFRNSYQENVGSDVLSSDIDLNFNVSRNSTQVINFSEFKYKKSPFAFSSFDSFETPSSYFEIENKDEESFESKATSSVKVDQQFNTNFQSNWPSLSSIHSEPKPVNDDNYSLISNEMSDVYSFLQYEMGDAQSEVFDLYIGSSLDVTINSNEDEKVYTFYGADVCSTREQCLKTCLKQNLPEDVCECEPLDDITSIPMNEVSEPNMYSDFASLGSTSANKSSESSREESSIFESWVINEITFYRSKIRDRKRYLARRKRYRARYTEYKKLKRRIYVMAHGALTNTTTKLRNKLRDIIRLQYLVTSKKVKAEKKIQSIIDLEDKIICVENKVKNLNILHTREWFKVKSYLCKNMIDLDTDLDKRFARWEKLLQHNKQEKFLLQRKLKKWRVEYVAWKNKMDLNKQKLQDKAKKNTKVIKEKEEKLKNDLIETWNDILTIPEDIKKHKQEVNILTVKTMKEEKLIHEKARKLKQEAAEKRYVLKHIERDIQSKRNELQRLKTVRKRPQNLVNTKKRQEKRPISKDVGSSPDTVIRRNKTNKKKSIYKRNRKRKVIPFSIEAEKYLNNRIISTKNKHDPQSFAIFNKLKEENKRCSYDVVDLANDISKAISMSKSPEIKMSSEFGNKMFLNLQQDIPFDKMMENLIENVYNTSDIQKKKKNKNTMGLSCKMLPFQKKFFSRSKINYSNDSDSKTTNNLLKQNCIKDKKRS